MVDKLSFRKGQRARTLFMLGNIVFFIVLSFIIIIPLAKVFIDSVDEKASTIQFRVWPEKFTMEAYQMILGQDRLYRP
ncbi:MAG: hypothetical protein EHM28_13050, partial [Spirochaetaceae bacterium]